MWAATKSGSALGWILWIMAVSPQLKAQPSEAQQQQHPVEALVAQLVSGDDQAAQAAAHQLAQRGPAAMPLLELALSSELAADRRVLALRVAAVARLSGSAVNGLRLGLEFDRDQVAPGGVVRMTVVVANLTDRPLAVPIARLQQGLAVERIEPKGACCEPDRFPVDVLAAESSKQRNPTVTLEPLGVLRFAQTWTLSGNSASEQSPRLDADQRLRLVLPSAMSEVVFRATLSVPSRRRASPDAPRPWHGLLISNQVKLHRLEAAAKPPGDS